MGLLIWQRALTFATVFHRILDFKTGLNFYSGPFSFYRPPVHRDAIALSFDHRDSILAEELIYALRFLNPLAHVILLFVRRIFFFLLDSFSNNPLFPLHLTSIWSSKEHAAHPWGQPLPSASTAVRPVAQRATIKSVAQRIIHVGTFANA